MPLTFDKPLPELRAYTEINPRPSDFDAYWDESLSELDAVDPRIEVKRNDTLPLGNAECFDPWFTGVGGARIHAQCVRSCALASLF